MFGRFRNEATAAPDEEYIPSFEGSIDDDLDGLERQMHNIDLDSVERRNETLSFVDRFRDSLIETEGKISPEMVREFLVNLANYGLESALSEMVAQSQGFQNWDTALEKCGVDEDGALIETEDYGNQQIMRRSPHRMAHQSLQRDPEFDSNEAVDDSERGLSEEDLNRPRKRHGKTSRFWKARVEKFKQILGKGSTFKKVVNLTALTASVLVAGPIGAVGFAGSVVGGVALEGVASYFTREKAMFQNSEGEWKDSKAYFALLGMVEHICDSQKIAEQAMAFVQQNEGKLSQKELQEFMHYSLNEIVDPIMNSSLNGVKEFHEADKHAKLWEGIGQVVGSVAGGSAAIGAAHWGTNLGMNHLASSHGSMRVVDGHLTSNPALGHEVSNVNGQTVFRLEPKDIIAAQQKFGDSNVWSNFFHGQLNRADSHSHFQAVVSNIFHNHHRQIQSYQDMLAAAQTPNGIPLDDKILGFLKQGGQLFHTVGPNFDMNALFSQALTHQALEQMVIWSAVMGGEAVFDSLKGLGGNGRLTRETGSLLQHMHKNMSPAANDKYSEMAGRAEKASPLSHESLDRNKFAEITGKMQPGTIWKYEFRTRIVDAHGQVIEGPIKHAEYLTVPVLRPGDKHWQAQRVGREEMGPLVNFVNQSGDIKSIAERIPVTDPRHDQFDQDGGYRVPMEELEQAYLDGRLTLVGNRNEARDKWSEQALAREGDVNTFKSRYPDVHKNTVEVEDALSVPAHWPEAQARPAYALYADNTNLNFIRSYIKDIRGYHTEPYQEDPTIKVVVAVDFDLLNNPARAADLAALETELTAEITSHQIDDYVLVPRTLPDGKTRVNWGQLVAGVAGNQNRLDSPVRCVSALANTKPVEPPIATPEGAAPERQVSKEQKYSRRELPAAETARIIADIQMLGTPAVINGMVFDPSTMLEPNGLQPSIEITTGGEKMLLSAKQFEFNGSRAGLAFIKESVGGADKYRIMPYIESVGQGVFRIHPEYDIDNSSGTEKIVSASAGYGEGGLVFSIALQEALAKESMSTTMTTITAGDPTLIFLGSLMRYNHPTPQLNEYGDPITATFSYPGNRRRVLGSRTSAYTNVFSTEEKASTLGNIKGVEPLDREPLTPPGEIKIEPADEAPDFTTVLRSWEQTVPGHVQSGTSNLERVTFEVFPSKGGGSQPKYRYLFGRIGKKKMWLAHVELDEATHATSLKTNKYGLHNKWVNAGRLEVSPYEHRRDLQGVDAAGAPRNYAGAVNPDPSLREYFDAYDGYIHHLPIIQEYRDSLVRRNVS